MLDAHAERSLCDRFLSVCLPVTRVYCARTTQPIAIILSPDERMSTLHCVSKNDTDVAGYIFNAHQPILIVFGR